MIGETLVENGSHHDIEYSADAVENPLLMDIDPTGEFHGPQFLLGNEHRHAREGKHGAPASLIHHGKIDAGVLPGLGVGSLPALAVTP